MYLQDEKLFTKPHIFENKLLDLLDFNNIL